MEGGAGFEPGGFVCSSLTVKESRSWSHARNHLTDEATLNRPRPRIETLADLIFGLALSVGAITLVSQPPTSASGIYNDLGTFGFSFIILISIWLRYTRIMSVMPVENAWSTRLNAALLFSVSVEPFLFGLLTRPPDLSPTLLFSFEGTASTLYALDLGGMMAIQGFFSLTLASEEKRLVSKEFAEQFRREANGLFVASGAFLVSILPFFYTTSLGPLGPIRYYVWLAPLLIVWLRRGLATSRGEGIGSGSRT